MGVTVSKLFREAFYPLSPQQIDGLPDWAEAHYDIDAKVSAEDIAAFQKLTRQERGAVLRAVLVERFKLSCHMAKRAETVYSLKVVKSGSGTIDSHADKTGAQANGGDGIQERGSLLVIDAHPYSMEWLARRISWLDDVNDRLVINRTGLTGFYDFKLSWSHKESAAPEDAPDASGPSLFTALKEQLGLELKPAKEDVDILIVDHLERPTPN